MSVIKRHNSNVAGAIPGAALEEKIAEVGQILSRNLGAVIDSLPGAPHTPQSLVRQVGVDKVFVYRESGSTPSMPW